MVVSDAIILSVNSSRSDSLYHRSSQLCESFAHIVISLYSTFPDIIRPFLQEYGLPRILSDITSMGPRRVSEPEFLGDELETLLRQCVFHL